MNVHATGGKRLRIGLVGPLPPPPGGMANQTRQLVHLLEQEGLHVEIVQTNSPYRPRCVGLVRGLRALFRLVPYLSRLWIVDGRVQLLHVMANSGWAWHLLAAPAVWLAKLRHVPVIINYRGGNAAQFFRRSFFWVRPTMWMSDQRVVPSGYLQQIFRSFGVSAEIVPNIIDLNSFTARALKPHPPCDSAHVVVTRKLEAIYDIPTVLYAFAILRKKRPAATLTIAGDGPEREKLVALAQDLNVVPYVKFVGNLTNDRIADLLTQADVLVNASLHDNLPVSILEALATGVPVVSTNVCGIPFLVKDHTTAILVPPSDPVAIAHGLLELLDNPELKDQLVRNGLELVQQYTWSSVRPRLMDVYSRLINDISE